MKFTQFTRVKEMISSPDKDNKYLAACLLRVSGTEQARKLLQTIPLEDRIRGYPDVCQEIGQPELTELDFNHLPVSIRRRNLAQAKLLQIEQCFNNGSIGIWYPYFTRTGRGLVFLDSYVHHLGFHGLVAFTSEFNSNLAGRLFIDIYTQAFGVDSL